MDYINEKKKSRTKKKSKKKTKRSYYSGLGMNGMGWFGRQAIYYPVLFPHHIFPNTPPPKLPDPIDFDYSSAADFTDGNPVGESDEYIDEQFIQILTFNDKGKQVKKRSDTFNKERFRKALSEGIVKFTFIKVNGQKRNAYGTTNIDILKQNNVPDIYDRLRKPTNNIRFYDLEKQGWRSFRPESLTVIYEKVISADSDKK